MCLCLSPLDYEDCITHEIKTILIPCGNCYECLLQEQNSWKIRMIEESKVWKNAYFFTLTYAPKNLPLNVVAESPEGREIVGELRGTHNVSNLLLDSYESVVSTACKDDIQCWLKRFRTTYIRNKARSLGVYVRDITSDKVLYDLLKPRFSYFITAEYAPSGHYVDRRGQLRKSTERPHYHGIIFTSLSRVEMLPLFADWRSRFGFVKFDKVRQRSDEANRVSSCANYCAKYCAKGCFQSRLNDVIDGIIEKPWRIMSKGIGKSYIDNMKSKHLFRHSFETYNQYVDSVLSRMYYFDGDYKYKLPRYYYERIFYKRIPVIREVFRKDAFFPVVTYRYIQTSMLSADMQIIIRNRPLALYQQRFEICRASYPHWSDDEIHSYLFKCEQASLESRANVARSKLHKFYKENELKNPQLMAC